ncbi:MAG: tetratricopeptide repeat protein [Bacteroidales bacterium]|nr:tetratricopeptide repeat protein [Bacteroidales bacterium]
MNRLIILLVTAFLLTGISCNNSGKEKIKENEIIATDPTAENLKILNDKIAQTPDDPALYNGRALIYLNLNNIDSAFRDINHALLLDSNKAEYYITLSDIYFAAGMVQNTLASLEKALIKNPTSNDALLKKAELHIYFEQYLEAIELAEKAISFERVNPKAYFIKGMTCKLNGDTANAIKNLQICVDQDPEYYHAYMQLGILFSSRRNPVAVEYYNNALNINPQSTEALYGLGMYYQENDLLNEALGTYNSLLLIDSTYKYAHYNIGYIHLVYLEMYREAIKYFNKAIQYDPNYVEAYYNRGYCFELLGDLMNARADYQHALSLRANYNLAIEGLNRID